MRRQRAHVDIRRQAGKHERTEEDSHGQLRRWFRLARPEEQAAGLPPPRAESGEDLARARRSRVLGVRRRRHQAGKQTSFPLSVKLKPGEVVMFSWIVYKSRADRDRVNAKVMKDPRLADMMDPKAIPFDVKRMVYGGFKSLVVL